VAIFSIGELVGAHNVVLSVMPNGFQDELLFLERATKKIIYRVLTCKADRVKANMDRFQKFM